MSDAALIGVDWGTSNFRAFLLDASGAILDRRSGPHGIMTVSDGDFAQTLARRIGDWLSDGRLPILMSGMIGSRQGWVEAPYVATPLGIGGSRRRAGARAVRRRRSAHRAGAEDARRRMRTT